MEVKELVRVYKTADSVDESDSAAMIAIKHGNGQVVIYTFGETEDRLELWKTIHDTPINYKKQQN